MVDLPQMTTRLEQCHDFENRNCAWAVGGGGWAFSWDMRHALELGVNWIDTAAVHGLGHSEEVVGRVLREPPSSGRRSPDFNEPGLSRNLALRDALRSIAHRHRATVSAAAGSLAADLPGVTGALVGGRSASAG